MPTPLLYGDYLYVMDDSAGIMVVYDAYTGEVKYRQRVPAEHGVSYASSGVAADGKLYYANGDGNVVVLKAGPQYELLATNKMGEPILASPAISESTIFYRMRHHVVAVESTNKATQ
jgi:outer membrane protein assembly factor BamB